MGERISLQDLITEIEDVMCSRELSDEYLIEHGHETGYVDEWLFGVTMVPAKYVLPFLRELEKRRALDGNL